MIQREFGTLKSWKEFTVKAGLTGSKKEVGIFLGTELEAICVTGYQEICPCFKALRKC